MANKRWLLASGLVLTAPMLIALWVGTARLVLNADIAFGWSSGAGRLPGHASSSVEIAIIALVASAVWLGGLWKVVQLWRTPRQR